jgi:hypothetical protein
LDLDAVIFSGVPNTESEPTSALTEGRLVSVLRRLHAEWQSAAGGLKLSASSSFSEVATRLSLDRGTAQRLVRISRIPEVEASDLSHFPGVRAWVRVVSAVEAALGESDPRSQTLALAAQHFSECLNDMGGSKSAALRDLKTHPDMRDASDARAQWVNAAADIIGYSVGTRLYRQMIRKSPDGAPSMDLATLDALHQCRGLPHASPFVLGGYSIDDKGKVFERPSQPSYFVLPKFTSNPMPAILSTGDDTRQTIYIEPQWIALDEPLNVAFLREKVAAFGASWAEDDWFELSLLNRHPTRRLILERVVLREYDEQFTATFRCYRGNIAFAPGGPWYDRLPEPAKLVRIGSPREAEKHPAPYPGYAELSRETFSRLDWSDDDLVLYRAVIDNPIPFAKYATVFTRNPK